MPEIQPKTPSAMIFAIFVAENGLFFSRFEIQNMVRDRYGAYLTRQTVQYILNQMPLTTNIERRGPKRQPIKLYALIISIQKTPTPKKCSVYQTKTNLVQQISMKF